MRGPMTLLEQVNAFRKSNRQHLTIDRTARQRIPVYSSLSRMDNENVELKTLSLGVYARKYLVTNTKLILPNSGGSRLGDLLSSSFHKDENHDENHRRRRRKRSSYRKLLFHSYSPSSSQTDLAQMNAGVMKPGLHVTIPTGQDDATEISYERDHVPPPSPSDTEIERLLGDPQDINQSRPSTPQSPVEKEEFIPFRLPKLRRSPRFRRTPINMAPKDIRSTLSNYLPKYY